jgi:hypothetical protein
MNKILVAALASSSLFVCSAAFADEPEAPPAPVAPAPVAPAPQAAAPRCVLGAHAGIDEADANTAAQLVCSEIFKSGPAAGTQYRVGLGKLGNVIILSVTAESAPGVISDHKQLQLSNIEEIPVAAPRIAESITKGTPLAQTQKVDNIVGDEARVQRKKSGSTHFAIGLIGVMPPLSSFGAPAPGIDLDLSYESQNFSINGGLRGGGTAGQDTTHVGYFALTVGGRYFVGDGDVSPYIGGGIAWTALSARTDTFDGDNSGLGAYGEVGVQALRTHRTHLTLGLRADLPFYSLRGSGSVNYTNSGYTTTPSSSLYYVPLTVALSITF